MNSYTIQNIVAASISNFYDLQNFIVHIIFEHQSLIQYIYIYINNLRKQKLPCIKQCIWTQIELIELKLNEHSFSPMNRNICLTLLILVEWKQSMKTCLITLRHGSTCRAFWMSNRNSGRTRRVAQTLMAQLSRKTSECYKLMPSQQLSISLQLFHAYELLKNQVHWGY